MGKIFGKTQRDKAKIFFFVLPLVLCLAILFFLPRLTIPLGLAYVLGLILKRPIPYLMKLGIGKTISITIMFLVLGFVVVFPIVKLVPLIQDEIQNLQYYIPKVESFFKDYYFKLRDEISTHFGVDIGDSLFEHALSYGHVGSKTVLMKIPNLLASIFEWALLIPFFLFFLLRDGRKFRYAFLRIVPNSIFERIYCLFHQFNQKLGDYILAKFIEASIIGLITVCGLLFFKVRFALLLGLAAAITNIVPYIGPILGVIPGLLICVIEYGFSSITGAVLLLYIGANIVDLAFVFPILVSKIVDIHPVIVVISVILGSQYMGIIGMVVSIPLAAIVKLIFEEIYNELYPAATLKHD